MPTYDYRCPNGHEFERFFRTISAAQPTVPCPECGAVAERRVSAGAGLLFKGSGFYITDYGKDGKKDQRPAAKADGAKGDGAKSDKADASPAAGSSSGEAKGEGAAKPAPSSGGTGGTGGTGGSSGGSGGGGGAGGSGGGSSSGGSTGGGGAA